MRLRQQAQREALRLDEHDATHPAGKFIDPNCSYCRALLKLDEHDTLGCPKDIPIGEPGHTMCWRRVG